jgi:6-phosphogluconolactonase (cycloisomerase 2 family)
MTTRTSLSNTCAMLVPVATAGLVFVTPAFASGVGRAASTIQHVESVVTGVPSGASSIAMSPDGLFLYVTGTDSDSIAVFSRDPSSGQIALLETHIDGVAGVSGLAGARGVVISPDGVSAYVSSCGDHITGAGIATFARDAGTGLLTFVESALNDQSGVFGLGGATAIAISPDGTSVYVTSGDNCNNSNIVKIDQAVAVFARNPFTGHLTFVEAEQENVNGVDGLDGAQAIGISNDGLNVYVGSGRYISGPRDDSVTTFTRNPLTGELSYVETIFVDTPPTLFLGPSGVVVSPDDQNVYVSAIDAHGVIVFSRDVSTGTLDFLEVEQDTPGLVEGAYWANWVGISPDGSEVHVVSETGTMATFERDLSNGLLNFSHAMLYTGPGPGLYGSVSGVMSPDGELIHTVAGIYSPLDTVSTVRRVRSCPVTPDPSCTQTTRPSSSRLIGGNEASRGDPSLRWIWKRGDTVTADDIGDPLVNGHMVLCIYDESPNDQPVFGATAPAAGQCRSKEGYVVACWRDFEKHDVPAFGYGDTGGRSPDGISELGLRGGDTGKPRFRMKISGPLMDPLPLPLTPPVRAQLRSVETGHCWEAVFSALQSNTLERFTGRSD